MLQIRNLRKSFGDLQVLKSIDLDVNKGDVVAILGPSGSGKTTMLRCLNFLEKSDGGTMLFDDQRVDLARVTHAEANALRRRTGFVFQSYNLFANKTALQNVTEGLIIARKMPRRRAEEIARAALVKVGMDDRADYYPSQLSGGQQQRVAIARATANQKSAQVLWRFAGAQEHRSGREQGRRRRHFRPQRQRKNNDAALPELFGKVRRRHDAV